MAERIPATPDGLAAAAALLRDGALVAMPTDTVYGIGCRTGDPGALDRLFEAKRRPAEKRIPILVANLEQVESLGFAVDERTRRVARELWPGALTLVLPPSRAGGETQAFRAPDHPVTLELIGRSGPLAVTSANRSGEPETYDADDVLIAFADSPLLDAVVDGGRVPGGVASTVVDLSGPRARILRPGPITAERLSSLAGPVD